MSEKVILERRKHTDYWVNFPVDNGRVQEIKWSGSKGQKYMQKTVSREVFDYLNLETYAIKHGELKLVEKTENFKQVYEEIVDKEDYEANSMSDEEINKILGLPLNQMKSKLNKVTSRTERFHIRDIAESNPDLAGTKTAFIEEWVKENPEE